MRIITVCIFIDSWEFFLCESYCLSKSFLWNMFFGWRRTKKTGWAAYFKIKEKDWLEIQSMAEKISKVVGCDGLDELKFKKTIDN